MFMKKSYTVEEIAKQLGVSRNSVYRKLQMFEENNGNLVNAYLSQLK
jgi:transposase